MALLLDWLIAGGALVTVLEIEHHPGDSLALHLVEVAAAGIATVAFVGAPIVAWRRSQRKRWLLILPIAAIALGGALGGRALYHHVQTVDADAKIGKAQRAGFAVDRLVSFPHRAPLTRDKNGHPTRPSSAVMANYQERFDSARSALAALNVTLVRLVPGEFLPQADMITGNLSFCFSVPLDSGTPGWAMPGTCEAPDWNSIYRSSYK